MTLKILFYTLGILLVFSSILLISVAYESLLNLHRQNPFILPEGDVTYHVFIP